MQEKLEKYFLYEFKNNSPFCAASFPMEEYTHCTSGEILC